MSQLCQVITASDQRSECAGAFSCASTRFADTSQVMLHCSGDSSCAMSSITGYASIKATGAYSLRDATIRTAQNQSSLDISFWGAYAGLGTTVFCGKDSTCNIWCHPNGCINTTFVCEGIDSSNCVINKEGESEHFHLYAYDTSELLIEADLLCDGKNMSFDVADLQPPLGREITVDETNEASICCRGHQSCYGASIQVENTTRDEHAVIVTATQGMHSVNSSGCREEKLSVDRNIHALSNPDIYSKT